MKVFFDTNVYVAEALLGEAAQRMVEAVMSARWRIYANQYLLDELARVLTYELGLSRRLAVLTQRRIVRRSVMVTGGASVRVPDDPKDTPILQAALSCGADYLVTNDRHLLALHPKEGLGIISMSAFHELLRQQGILKL